MHNALDLTSTSHRESSSSASPYYPSRSAAAPQLSGDPLTPPEISHLQHIFIPSRNYASHLPCTVSTFARVAPDYSRRTLLPTGRVSSLNTSYRSICKSPCERKQMFFNSLGWNAQSTHELRPLLIVCHGLHHYQLT